MIGWKTGKGLKKKQWLSANNIYSYEKKNEKARKAKGNLGRERDEREEEDEQRGREKGESNGVYPQSIGDHKGSGSERK